MKIRLLAVGRKMPAWVNDGFNEYRKRLPRHLNLELKEISPGRRGPGLDPAAAIAAESTALTRACRGAALTIALDERGEAIDSPQLARWLERWMRLGGDVALLVGGPDGLASDVLKSCRQSWSLGPLTLPHPLVRVLLAEQLYRAWTLLEGHPYHRA